MTNHTPIALKYYVPCVGSIEAIYKKHFMSKKDLLTMSSNSLSARFPISFPLVFRCINIYTKIIQTISV